MKRRLVMAVTCVPIPPDFFDLPLRQMMLPFIGRVPVNSQIFDITIFLQKEPEKLPVNRAVARIIYRKLLRKSRPSSPNSTPFPFGWQLWPRFLLPKTES